MIMLKRTPLFAAHQSLGGRLIEFGGWEMPVQYSSIREEHLAVRRAAGLFDISHMGEVAFAGPGAETFLNRLLTNDVGKLAAGQGQYTLMCNEAGGVVDDLYAYRLAAQDYLLIINASRIEADVSWMEQQRGQLQTPAPFAMRHVSDQTSAVAVQGPKVVEFIDDCFPGPSTGGTEVPAPSGLKKNRVGRWTFDGIELWVARTGYTGEDGFEVVAPATAIEAVWNLLLEKGGPFGLIPAGLGARDTLRTEVCYPLYGHELDEQTTPIEAGLARFVALGKESFVGREALSKQVNEGVARTCVAFKMTGRSAPPRPHYPIWNAGDTPQQIGEVVSGTQSPSLEIGIGMGYVTPDQAAPGTAIQIEIRGRRSPAEIVAKPIFRKRASS